jgi:sugar lactone lactonase YvrE
VSRVDLATGQVTLLAGAPQQAGSDDGAGGAARFAGPQGLAFVPGSPDRLYVADTGNHTIRAIDLSIGMAIGMVTTPLGTTGVGATLDGVGTAAQFARPTALAADAAGNLYVAEAGRVRRVDLHSGTVWTFLGSGQRGVLLGELPGSLNRPAGIAVLDDSELWIVNRGEGAIVSAHAR